MNDNNKSIHRAIKELKEIRMTEEERTALRLKLDKVIQANKAAEMTAASAFGNDGGYGSGRSYPSPYSFSSISLGALAAVLILAAALVSGAEGSLPGDSLYAMKVGIVEPMRGTSHRTAEAVARWEAGLVDTRLKEAETLASAGELNDAKREKIEKMLDRHTSKYVASLNSVDPEKARGLEVGLRAAIWSHVNILEGITVYASSTPAGKDPKSVESAAQLKKKAAKHLEDLRASWSMPLKESATTSGEFIKTNVKVSATTTMEVDSAPSPQDFLQASTAEAVQSFNESRSKKSR